jgi:hypothetical protein
LLPLNGSNATNHRLVFTIFKPIPFVPQRLDQMVLEDHLVVPETIAIKTWQLLGF